jgi:hypothetical protein
MRLSHLSNSACTLSSPAMSRFAAARSACSAAPKMPSQSPREDRTVILPHPMLAYMENPCRDRKCQCRMTVRPWPRVAAVASLLARFCELRVHTHTVLKATG